MMCILFVAYKVHPDYPLILLANRDEFWSRPAEKAHFWPEAPYVLAGRDKSAGGTWLGINRRGQLAAVTNYRDNPRRKAPRSRGELVSRFLLDHEEPEKYLQGVSDRQGEYSGYNLLVGSIHGLYYHSNRLPHSRPLAPLAPGIYGLSNHLLDTPWFKVEKGKKRLGELLKNPYLLPQHLFHLLADQEKAPDELLPSSFLDRQVERLHSSIFIKDSTYGTRCSTIVLVDGKHVRFSERSYTPDYSRFVERSFVFPLEHVVN